MVAARLGRTARAPNPDLATPTPLTDEAPVDLLLHTLAGLDAWMVYTLLALLVLGESGALVAVLFPGELALVAAGVFVARGQASFGVVVVVAVVAAVAGHATSYLLGRRYGLRLLETRLLRRYARALGGATSLVTRHGALAVFLGRWMNLGRVLVPLLVGAGRMPVRAFTVYNVLGAVAWVTTFVTLGTVAGASLDVVERTLGHVGWATSAGVAIAVGSSWIWRRARRQRRRRAVAGDRGDDEVTRMVGVLRPSGPVGRA